MNQYINQKAFLALIREGLWGVGNPDIRVDVATDWQEVYRLATEQSVLGLVLAGLEHVDVKPPKELLLQWIGEVQQIEQRNKAMNKFIVLLFERMQNADVNPILVKGQGVAQCYERPYWRACGDIDLLFSDIDYEKSKELLAPISSSIDIEDKKAKHIAYTVNNWIVELHGSLHSGLTSKLDKELDSIQKDTIVNQNIRKWENDGVTVSLPGVDNDIIFIFTHILQHFFRGGIGLRQICDWCRLLWTYKDSLNHRLLESRIRKMGLMTEWKAFASFAVIYLNMPKEAMPFYCDKRKSKTKAHHILLDVLESGNFGHKKDMSYRKEGSFVIRKVTAIWRYTAESIKHASIFPLDSVRIWWNLMRIGVRNTLKNNEDN
jgi:hypothetical protein